MTEPKKLFGGVDTGAMEIEADETRVAGEKSASR